MRAELRPASGGGALRILGLGRQLPAAGPAGRRIRPAALPASRAHPHRAPPVGRRRFAGGAGEPAARAAGPLPLDRPALRPGTQVPFCRSVRGVG